jgi:hypothetical protein
MTQTPIHSWKICGIRDIRKRSGKLFKHPLNEVDLEEHFTKEEWNKLKEREQREWFEQYCENLATSDLEMT